MLPSRESLVRHLRAKDIKEQLTGGRVHNASKPALVQSFLSEAFSKTAATLPKAVIKDVFGKFAPGLMGNKEDVALINLLKILNLVIDKVGYNNKNQEEVLTAVVCLAGWSIFFML